VLQDIARDRRERKKLSSVRIRAQLTPEGERAGGFSSTWRKNWGRGARKRQQPAILLRVQEDKGERVSLPRENCVIQEFSEKYKKWKVNT